LVDTGQEYERAHRYVPYVRVAVRSSHLVKLKHSPSAPPLLDGIPNNATLARLFHIIMLMVWRPPTRLHESKGSDLGRMMHSSSSCSLATSTTSRRHGTNTSVIGMIQIARFRISIASPLVR
jgi:hypothetical protein